MVVRLASVACDLAIGGVGLMAGVLLGYVKSLEDPEHKKGQKPPFWCSKCDVGQSIRFCFVCGGWCEETQGRAMVKQRYEADEPRFRGGRLPGDLEYEYEAIEAGALSAAG